MKKLLAISFVLTTGISHAGNIDIRLSNDDVDKTYAGRVFVSNTWENGWGASVDTPFNMTRKTYSGDVDKLVSATNEYTLSKNFKLDSGLYIKPGLSVQVGTAGSTSRPWLTIGKKITNDWEASIRYRHNLRNYDTVDLAGKPNKDSSHNITIWNGYKVNEWLNVEWQFDYIQKINNFYTDNKESAVIENEFVAVFPNAFGKGVTPYVLIDHLGKYTDQNKNLVEHWRPRVGVKIAF